MRIRSKLSSLLVITGGIPLLIALVVIYYMGIDQRRNIIGANFQQLSEKVRENVKMSLQSDIRSVTNLSKLSITRYFLKRARSRPPIDLEKPWSDCTDEDLKDILDNPLAGILNAFNSIEYTFGEIFATDNLGKVVAATNKTSDYWQQDEDWWIIAYNNGKGQLFLSDVGFDESAGIHSIDICVPVLDGNDEVVGVIKAVMNIERVFESIIGIDVEGSGKAVLAKNDGTILLSKDLILLQDRLPDEEIPNARMGSSGWFITQLPDRTKKLVGFARISLTLPESSYFTPWLVIVSQESHDAFAPVRKLIWYVSVPGAALILFFFLSGIYLAEKKVVSPLSILTQTVKRVANGDLTRKVQLRSSKDEINELGYSFNQMVSNLRKRTSLDDISFNILSHLKLDDVLVLAMDTLKNVFDAAFARIWLIGDGDLCDECIHAEICQNREQCLHLEVSVGIYAKNEQYRRIPLGGLKVGKIAESREFSVINNLAKNGQIYDLRWHQRKGVVAFAGYPLIFGDELLGVLAIFGRRPLSDEELGILGSFVSRITLGIQNAKLHSEIRDLILNLEKKVEERTQELELANVKLTNADRMKSEFLANMSHELRTPLNAIIGFAEVLRDGLCGELNDDQMMSVIDIYESGKHLLQMINAILDLSKVEAGKMELQPEEFSLGITLDTSQSIVRDLANKKNLFLQTVVPEDLPNIYADPVKFKQIMYNLLANAVKFTQEGGTITTSAVLDGDEFTISVTDTGIGLNPEDLASVFDEFKQVDGSRSREYEGTGLGLALTRKFVELHGGKIWAESEGLGKGSKFSFTLPFHDLELEISQNILDRLPPTAQEIAFDSEEKTILVVEDNPQAAQLLCIYLAEAGYNPVVVNNGEKAVKMAQEINPFAITLDIMLPGKGGWQVMQELKEFEDTCNIPVIIISIVDNQSLGFSMGAVGYLTKPIEKEDFKNILNQLELATKVDKLVPRVLIVDDKPEDLKLMESILQNEGFDVLKASGGEEGITKAVMEHPDLIVLDLLMPSVSGFDVVQSLQKQAEVRSIPVIICTMKDLTAEDLQRLNSKVQSIVQKGEDAKTHLLEAVRNIEQFQKARAEERGNRKREVEQVANLPEHVAQKCG